jgi:hypothetical protein
MNVMGIMLRHDERHFVAADLCSHQMDGEPTSVNLIRGFDLALTCVEALSLD